MILKYGCLNLICLLVWSQVAQAEVQTKQDSCPKIRHIHIDVRDVYEEEDEPNFLESSLNFFHFTTQESVVRKELLFEENSCLDTELVEETARNLRALPIFSDAHISLTPLPDSQDVDVYVQTKDRFTLRAEISASHNSGTTKTRISFGDKNMFGLNKSLHFSQSKEEGETLSRYIYNDSRFFHDYAVSAAYIDGRDGGLESYYFIEPFRSLDDRSSYSFGYVKNTQDFVINLDDNEELEVPQFYESQEVAYHHEFGSRQKSERLGFALSSAQQDYFSELVSEQASIPERLKKIDFDITGSITDRNEYIVMEGLDSLVYREDIELLKSIFFGVGAQWRDDGNNTEIHPKYQIGIRQTRYNHENVLSSYYLSHSGRFHQGKLLEAHTTAFYHCYYLPRPGHVWLGGVTYQYRYGDDILNSPLTMGGDVGLRGYEASSFTGNKSLLLNLEYRHRLPTIWSKVAIGQAFFVDSGFAWKQGEAMEFKDLKANVGWGLRFDIPSIFGQDILRFDLAVETETGDVLASVVLGQIFRYDELTENTQQEF